MIDHLISQSVLQLIKFKKNFFLYYWRLTKKLDGTKISLRELFYIFVHVDEYNTSGVCADCDGRLHKVVEKNPELLRKVW